MSNTDLKYTYALDENEKIIEVSLAVKGGNYHCPYCKERMIIREGQKKRKHFAHYRNTEHCSYETYLHSLAKMRIEEWFNSDKDFGIEIKVLQPCKNYDKCIWKNLYYNSHLCNKEEIIKYNLKGYYNNIAVEKKYKGLIPDLLLTNNGKEDYPPIFIEVCVSHPCSVEKMNSNNHIIEIKLKNEQELENIISSNVLRESSDVIFYNFIRDKKPTDVESILKLSKIIVYEDMKVERKNVNCKNFDKRVLNSIYEITYPKSWDNPALFGVIKAHEEFPSLKNCVLCTHHGNYINNCPCYKYKDLELTNTLSKSCANNCPSYRLATRRVYECLKITPQLPFHIWKKD